MAYFSWFLVPGVCVHPPWGQSGQPAEGNPEYICSMVSDRILAWGGMEFYFLGSLLRAASVFGEICAEACAGAASESGQAYLHDGICNDRLGLVLFAGDGERCEVYRHYVRDWSPWICRRDGGLLFVELHDIVCAFRRVLCSIYI